MRRAFSFVVCALLCYALAFDPAPAEPSSVDSLVARLLLDTLDGLKRGDLKSTNSTDWMAVWGSVGASPDTEWRLTKRAVALIVIAAKGAKEVVEVVAPVRPSKKGKWIIFLLFFLLTHFTL